MCKGYYAYELCFIVFYALEILIFQAFSKVR